LRCIASWSKKCNEVNANEEARSTEYIGDVWSFLALPFVSQGWEGGKPSSTRPPELVFPPTSLRQGE